ncbi:MAG: histidinol-phosphatase [Chloroflexi bacterium]|nr:histidinol-phosphatase [Chloroflexota bacterium]
MPTATHEPDERRAWLDFALDCADAADDLALTAFRGAAGATAKADGTLVTETDRAIERLVRERLAASHPGHGVVGEEYGEEGGRVDVRWFVDPIDGTHNFVRGIPIFATLLAVEAAGRLELAVVSAPALGRRWHALRGEGAWVVDGGREAQPVRVSTIDQMRDAQVLYSSAQVLATDARIPGFASLVRDCWRERGFGDFWGYMLVAEGAAEVMIEAGIEPYDLAGPALIVAEAGGQVTDFAGAPDRSGASVVATNGLVHEEVLRRLGQGAQGSAGGQEAAAASASPNVKRPS